MAVRTNISLFLFFWCFSPVSGQDNCALKPAGDSLGHFKLSGFLTEEQARSIPFELPEGEFYKARKLYPNGFNEIFDNCGRILSRGDFRNGSIYTGFVSIYDSYGNFVTADLYEHGNYICSSPDHSELTVYSDPSTPSDVRFHGNCFGPPSYDTEPDEMLKTMLDR